MRFKAKRMSMAEERDMELRPNLCLLFRFPGLEDGNKDRDDQHQNL
jgi:hypothetical protein